MPDAQSTLCGRTMALVGTIARHMPRSVMNHPACRSSSTNWHTNAQRDITDGSRYPTRCATGTLDTTISPTDPGTQQSMCDGDVGHGRLASDRDPNPCAGPGSQLAGVCTRSHGQGQLRGRRISLILAVQGLNPLWLRTQTPSWGRKAAKAAKVAMCEHVVSRSPGDKYAARGIGEREGRRGACWQQSATSRGRVRLRCAPCPC